MPAQHCVYKLAITGCMLKKNPLYIYNTVYTERLIPLLIPRLLLSQAKPRRRFTQTGPFVNYNTTTGNFPGVFFFKFFYYYLNISILTPGGQHLLEYGNTAGGNCYKCICCCLSLMGLRTVGAPVRTGVAGQVHPFQLSQKLKSAERIPICML